MINENQKYITSFLNTRSYPLSLFVNGITDKKLAKSEYFSKMAKLLELLDSFEQMMHNLGVSEVDFNAFFNVLYSLRNKGFNDVDRLLEKYKYADVLNKKYNAAKKMILDGNIPQGELKKVMEFYFSNGLVTNHEDIAIYEFYIKYTLMREQPLSFEAFKAMMIGYAQICLSKSGIKQKIGIASKAKNENGIFYLSSDELDEMFKSGSFIALETLFKEVMMVRQFNDVHVKKIKDDRTKTLIEDEIIAKFVPKYLEENKNNTFSEIESKIYGITKLLSFFERNGISIGDSKKNYSDKLVDLERLLQSNSRKYYGRSLDIKELFKFICSTNKDAALMYTEYSN